MVPFSFTRRAGSGGGILPLSLRSSVNGGVVSRVGADVPPTDTFIETISLGAERPRVTLEPF